MNRKRFGYILFGLSFTMWLAPFFIGMLSIPLSEKAVIISAFIVTGEVMFVLSLFILGKPFWQNVKENVKHYWNKIIKKKII